MAVFKCKMCGGDLDISEGMTVAECEYCGSKQTVPVADNEKKITLFGRATRLLHACEFDKAAGVYESIVSEFPEEAEAYWGLILTKYGIEYVDDPASGKKTPTCHRSSFESVMEDSNFEQALENADAPARALYREEAKRIEELRKGIIEISNKEEPYDVFICYKETAPDGDRTIDSVIAQDVYTALTEKGYRVFFSRISLEDKLGVAYEPYIFAALNSAKIMLAFGTDYEYYNAVWVKNEWSRFLHLIAKGEKKTLIPCYKNIDAYDMPKEFARLQAQDMGKVGAIQDLLRGIEKILPKTPVAQTVVQQTVVQQTVVQNVQNGVDSVLEPLLKRAFMFLEDGKWDSANEYCEKVLDLDPECAEAYLGKLMAAKKINQKEKLKKCEALVGNANYEKALKFSNPELKKELKEFADAIAARELLRRNRPFEDEDVYMKASDGSVSIISVPKHLQWSSKKLVIPDEICGMPVKAIIKFHHCHAEEIVLPSSLEFIGEDAFSFSTMTTVTIPQGMTSINKSAFRGCRNLTSVIIPSSATVIQEKAFENCENLIKIIVPDGVTAIEDSAFSGCKKLSSITIPSSVKKIGDRAFRSCFSLASINIPDGVKSLGKLAFSQCEKLTSITIPHSVSSIGNDAFSHCANLERASISKNITCLPEGLFSYCKKLNHITILGPVTQVGRCAFSDCDRIKRVVLLKKETFYLYKFSNSKQISVISVEEEEKIQRSIEWRRKSLCQHCGGEFKKVLFGFKCTSCGKKKDY